MGQWLLRIAPLPHCLIASLLLVAPLKGSSLPVEILKATGSLPARLVEQIESPRAYVETSKGVALVLDGGRQAVFAIDVARGTAKRIVQVGTEDGHIMGPSGFALAPNDIFAVTDQPGTYARVQYFGDDGTFVNRFWLASRPGVRMALGRMAMGGAGALAFTGRTFLINAPGAGALINEFDASGQALRSIGTLRATGQESDAALHAALNTGLPIIDPGGGFFFVFDTGVPIFRKYDAGGRLLFERHIEGAEIDGQLRALPTRWNARAASESWPYAPGLVQAAAVDPAGSLWVSLMGGYTYVYDRQGDKIRVVQFDAAGPVAPISLFFAKGSKGDRILVTPGCYEFPSR
jgi:hypothetical protein